MTIVSYCPECGIDLTAIDRYAHALTHWPERIPDESQFAEARRRQALLLNRNAGSV